MDWKGLLHLAKTTLSRNTPAILTGMGILGFGTSIVMTAKASPKVKVIHEAESWERDWIKNDDEDESSKKEKIRESYFIEAKKIASLYGPVAAVALASATCIVMSTKISSNRHAALAAAYSLSTETLSRYQGKVIEKLGEEVHKEVLDDATKDLVRGRTPENLNPDTIVVPEGTIRCFDAVTGRYFFSTKEKILEAESEINKKLINEVRVPLQEFYYELGLEEKFSFADSSGWDISNPYYNAGNLDIYFTPMLDDDKNPCLALNYHVTIFDRQV